MKALLLVLILFLCLSFFVSCAAGGNELKWEPNEEGRVAGFWLGIWHGIISPITFIISLFNKNVNIYDVHNNGGWYNFGFILGLMIVFGSSGGAGKHAHSRRCR